MLIYLDNLNGVYAEYPPVEPKFWQAVLLHFFNLPLPIPLYEQVLSKSSPHFPPITLFKWKIVLLLFFPIKSSVLKFEWFWCCFCLVSSMAACSPMRRETMTKVRRAERWLLVVWWWLNAGVLYSLLPLLPWLKVLMRLGETLFSSVPRSWEKGPAFFGGEASSFFGSPFWQVRVSWNLVFRDFGLLDHGRRCRDDITFLVLVNCGSDESYLCAGSVHNPRVCLNQVIWELTRRWCYFVILIFDGLIWPWILAVSSRWRGGWPFVVCTPGNGH